LRHDILWHAPIDSFVQIHQEAPEAHRIARSARLTGVSRKRHSVEPAIDGREPDPGQPSIDDVGEPDGGEPFWTTVPLVFAESARPRSHRRGADDEACERVGRRHGAVLVEGRPGVSGPNRRLQAVCRDGGRAGGRAGNTPRCVHDALGDVSSWSRLGRLPPSSCEEAWRRAHRPGVGRRGQLRGDGERWDPAGGPTGRSAHEGTLLELSLSGG
jgi:hypothetical protein